MLAAFVVVLLLIPVFDKCSGRTLRKLSLSAAGSQSSLYLHRALIGKYISTRAQHIGLSAYVHMLSRGITDNELRKFYGKENLLEDDDIYSTAEHRFVDFVVDEKMPNARTYPDLIAVPIFIYGVGLFYNVNPFKSAPAQGGPPLNRTVATFTPTQIIKMYTKDASMDTWGKVDPDGTYNKESDLTLAQYQATSVTVYVQSGQDAATDLLITYMTKHDSGWFEKFCIYKQRDNSCPTVDTATLSRGFGNFRKLGVSENLYKYIARSPDAALGAALNSVGSITYSNWLNVYDDSKMQKIGRIMINGAEPRFTEFDKSVQKFAEMQENGSIPFPPDPFKIVSDLATLDGYYPLLGYSYIILRKGLAGGPEPPATTTTAKPKRKSRQSSAEDRAAVVASASRSDCDPIVEVLRYIRWIHYDPDAVKTLRAKLVVALPDATYEMMMKSLSNTLMCYDERTKATVAVWDIMLRTIAEEEDLDLAYIIGMYVLIPMTVIILAAIIFWRRLTAYKLARKVARGQFEIPSRNIDFIQTSKERYREMLRMRPYMDNCNLNTEFRTGEYGFCVVLLRHLFLDVNSSSLCVREELIHMQEWRQHKNLVKFLGICEVHRNNYIVSELSLLGDLRTLLSNTSVKLTIPISFCMARGMAEGVKYLHAQGIIHGNLRSPSVYVESDWTVKISDWEYTHLYSLQGLFVSREHVFKSMQRAPPEMHNVFFTPLLWTAPELLKAALDQKGLYPTKEADAYAAGVIFYEILTRSTPYKFDVELGKGPLSLLLRVLNPKKPLRPLDLESEEVLNDMPESMINLMRACWSENPQKRVSAHGLSVILGRVEADTKRMADLTVVNTGFIIEKAKAGIKNTNSEVKQRLQDLRKANEDFLTPKVYEKIKAKLPVEPQVTKRAYILHLTMVEYSELLDPTHGESAIALIERFQMLVSQHIFSMEDANIFRLHTNGDDCTIIAAIPSGGIEYADKVAVMALDLIAITWKAVMLDIDTDHIKIRLGIHCGPVLSGLYGNDHSEFTVIGDARDIAEDMERLSATYRILITQEFLDDLRQFSGYQYIENTDEMRRHDKFVTYWLLGRDRYAEQESLDAIKAQYGEILTGRVPYRARPKTAKQLAAAAKAAGAKASAERVGGARRLSMQAHQALKDELKDAPAILERRVGGSRVRKKKKRKDKSPRHKSKRRKAPKTGQSRYLSLSAAQSQMDDDDEMSVLQMDNNRELIVVNVKNRDEGLAPYSATLGPADSVMVLHQVDGKVSLVSLDEVPEKKKSRFEATDPSLRFLNDTSLDESLDIFEKTDRYAVPNEPEPLEFATHFRSTLVDKKVRKNTGVQVDAPVVDTDIQGTQTSFHIMPNQKQVQSSLKIIAEEINKITPGQQLATTDVDLQSDDKPKKDPVEEFRKRVAPKTVLREAKPSIAPVEAMRSSLDVKVTETPNARPSKSVIKLNDKDEPKTAPVKPVDGPNTEPAKPTLAPSKVPLVEKKSALGKEMPKVEDTKTPATLSSVKLPSLPQSTLAVQVKEIPQALEPKKSAAVLQKPDGPSATPSNTKLAPQPSSTLIVKVTELSKPTEPVVVPLPNQQLKLPETPKAVASSQNLATAPAVLPIKVPSALVIPSDLKLPASPSTVTVTPTPLPQVSQMLDAPPWDGKSGQTPSNVRLNDTPSSIADRLVDPTLLPETADQLIKLAPAGPPVNAALVSALPKEGEEVEEDTDSLQSAESNEAFAPSEVSNLPSVELPHSHEAFRTRRRVKRRKFRPSIHGNAGVENPVAQLDITPPTPAPPTAKEANEVSPVGRVAALAARFSQPDEPPKGARLPPSKPRDVSAPTRASLSKAVPRRSSVKRPLATVPEVPSTKPPTLDTNGPEAVGEAADPDKRKKRKKKDDQTDGSQPTGEDTKKEKKPKSDDVDLYR